MSRRIRDRRRDMRSRRDMRYDIGYSDRYTHPEYDSRYGDYNYSQSDYARGRMDSQSSREYDRHYEYPYMSDYARSRRTGRYIRDRRDYGPSEDYLSEDELMEWKEDLLHELEPQFKPQFEDSRVIQRAKEMGVDFKDFTEDEFVVTAIMIATDFGKTVGMNNTDQMFRMAYDWLIDPDADIKGSEKLSVYYDEIVCADD